MIGSDKLIDLAIEEDAGLGDLTSRAIFPASHRSTAVIDAKEDLVVCGLEVAAKVFSRVDPTLKLTLLAADGDRIKPGRNVLRVAGSTISILTAERTALNFLQRLSGVATQSRRYADAVKATAVRIVDTRKTTPGFRVLEKYAVRCGGCHNHRASLGEHVLIKDNHIAAAGSIATAISRARDAAPHTAKIEVEAKTLTEVKACLAAKAEVILLDNMSPAEVKAAVKVIARRALVEVSGGVRFETLLDYALPGVDVISIGALTHSAHAVDLSLNLLPTRAGSTAAGVADPGRAKPPSAASARHAR